jgi:hypothetical protein
MSAFDYPIAPHTRKHGPVGYATYAAYRPWLRDDFTFRCVYCLAREQWGRVTGEFGVDHFQPQARSPQQALDYENLLYCCQSCNALKGNSDIPNPWATLTAEHVRVKADGTIEGLTRAARKIIRVLALDSESCNRWRRLWLRNIELATEHSPDQYLELMGFPDDLPDLSRLCPPGGNSRLDGVEQSYFAQRQRGELQETY